MDITTTESIKTVGEVFSGSSFKSLLDIYTHCGDNSPEFEQAKLNHRIRMAVVEARYQVRRAENQAELYERGY